MLDERSCMTAGCWAALDITVVHVRLFLCLSAFLLWDPCRHHLTTPHSVSNRRRVALLRGLLPTDSCFVEGYAQLVTRLLLTGTGDGCLVWVCLVSCLVWSPSLCFASVHCWTPCLVHFGVRPNFGARLFGGSGAWRSPCSDHFVCYGYVLRWVGVFTHRV